MKKLLLALILSAAATARAQIIDFAYHLTASSYPLNGGLASSGSSVGPYSGTPVLGDMIYFDGTNWVSLAAPANGTYGVTFTSSIPSWGAVGGAPTTAQYWTGAADGTLSAEKNLGALSTGLVLNTGGVPTTKAANTCTAQFPRSDNASGVWTCATVDLAADVGATIVPLANGGTNNTTGMTSATTMVGPYRDEFMGNLTGVTSTQAGPGSFAWTVTNTGGTGPGNISGSFNGTGAALAEHPGIIALSTGTGSGAGASTLAEGNGVVSANVLATELFAHAESLEFETCVSALSGGGDTYTLREGWGDLITGGAYTDGCWVEYTDTVNSGKWVMTCKNNAGPTTTNSNTAPTVCPTFQKIRLLVNSNATSVAATFDGVDSTAAAANIPTAAGREFGIMFAIVKTAGTTSRYFALDYVEWWKTVSR